jgi:hypothetical protein
VGESPKNYAGKQGGSASLKSEPHNSLILCYKIFYFFPLDRRIIGCPSFLPSLISPIIPIADICKTKVFWGSKSCTPTDRQYSLVLKIVDTGYISRFSNTFDHLNRNLTSSNSTPSITSFTIFYESWLIKPSI